MQTNATIRIGARTLSWLMLGLINAIGSCASYGTDEIPSLTVSLTHFGQPVSERFLAVVETKERQIASILCPVEDPVERDNLVCTESGFRIINPAATFELTVKAPGYYHLNQSVSLSRVTAPDGEATLGLSLTKLDPFETNRDFSTGFEADGGAEAFENMAVVTESDFGPAQAVKFYISDIRENPRVYFQNTTLHQLHYEFARSVLGVASNVSDFEFDTYTKRERTAVAGTLVRYPLLQTKTEDGAETIASPITVTFFPSDTLSPDQALRTYQLIEERLLFLDLKGGRNRLIYLPAGATQESEVSQDDYRFAVQGALWMGHSELFGKTAVQILNAGLAYGILKRLSPEELKTTVLSYTDIVILTRLPNELPVVGGTITEELQSPLAHVNVAARARGTPNIALVDAWRRPEISQRLGKLVRFEVKDGSFTLDDATADEARAFWENRRSDTLSPQFDLSNKALLGFSDIQFKDSISVGAKAANLAELSTLLKEQAPHGFAVPFYYYNAFIRAATLTESICQEARIDCLEEDRESEVCDSALELCLTGGAATETISDYIDRVLDDPDFRSDSVFREAVLDGVRYAIRHIDVDRDFASEIDQRVAEIFGADKVKLRSSTNAEDLPEFSGAGLYDSVGAYATGDKSASRQIRKVWASVWNYKAFEERGFWNIDHRAVQMGVAVNQAFTDEAANGVLITQNIVDPYVFGMYVNVQKGEVSVTNPEDGSTPEIFSIVAAPGSGIQRVHYAFSSLNPDAPILSNAEMQSLYDAAALVQTRFSRLYGETLHAPVFDLEFKFYGPERALFIKQVRPYLSWN